MEINKIKNLTKEVLSNRWATLYEYTFDYLRRDNVWESQKREVYDKGNGATILLFNRLKQTVILTRQFRIPTYLNGNKTGMMIETCAGLLDEDNAEDCIKREVLEETGYEIKTVQKLFEVFMTPGADKEKTHFFIGEYEPSMKKYQGGGLQSEQEEIEVLEFHIDEAMQMIKTGDIADGKTIILLQYAKLHQIL